MIKVIDLVGKNAISMQSGTKLYEKIFPKLAKKEKIELSFEGVSLYASPFFNASIGLLLKDISIDELMSNMKIIEINDIGRDLLNDVIQNALTFYGEQSSITEILDQASDKKGNDGELN
tara:strand:- start:8146 stop:8502 length:357 start_codon:yes stop_codon:yes gene_type:complete